MLWTLLVFLAGIYAGVVLNQRYELPTVVTPFCERGGQRPVNVLLHFPELKEAFEKLVAMERRLRKNPQGEQAEEEKPTTSPKSPPREVEEPHKLAQDTPPADDKPREAPPTPVVA